MPPENFTETDKKIVYSDHDLLVRLNTIMDMQVKQWSDFMTRYTADSTKIVERITTLEVNRASDLASIKANKEDIETVCNDIGELRKKSNWLDGINAAATAVVGAIALFWGGSK